MKTPKSSTVRANVFSGWNFAPSGAPTSKAASGKFSKECFSEARSEFRRFHSTVPSSSGSANASKSFSPGSTLLLGAAAGAAITGVAVTVLFDEVQLGQHVDYLKSLAEHRESSRLDREKQEKLKLEEKKQKWARYVELLNNHPNMLGPLGDATKGEIEIVLDEKSIQQIQDKFKVEVGILGETPWHLWFCDAVKNPNGELGMYTRLIWKKALTGEPGAVILPFMKDGKILLNVIYRHALRRWTIELPRGVGNGEKNIEDLAKRELREETGAKVSGGTLLGRINADSGITPGNVGIYQALVEGFGMPDRDASEASIKVIALTPEEFEEGIMKGVKVKINGQDQLIKIEDSFTVYAYQLSALHRKFGARKEGIKA